MNFYLEDSFIKKFVNQQPNWGPLGYITYKRTYARPLLEGSLYPRHLELAQKYNLHTTEEWWLTLVRVVEGTYEIQRKHCENLKLPWDSKLAQRSAQEMFLLMWNFKFTPPGRGLWMMGVPIINKIGSGALNNCAFISTAEIDTNFSSPFCFLMDMSMLGVGVGGDSRGAGKVIIEEPKMGPEHIVEDSREGWVEVIRRILDSYVGKDTFPEKMDFSQIRSRGTPIKGFGGIASGSDPLAELIKSITELLNSRIGKKITSSNIVDLFNLIGRCVVSGNTRRSAEIVFGDPYDIEFLELKDPEKAGKLLESHRWASNNSVFAKVGQDYSECAKKTAKNGEPGYMWLDNARNFSRMGKDPDFSDLGASGGNPCFAEDTLIAVADGRNAVSIKQLAEEGKDIPVYSVADTGKVEIKWARNPRKTREKAKLLKIILDDDSIIKVTPDHKMIMRDGSYREAKDLKENDSLAPFRKWQEQVDPKKNGQFYWRTYGDLLDLDIRESENELLKKIIQTDLSTVWINEQLYANKNCKTCNRVFIVPWRFRDQMFCRKLCANKVFASITARKNGKKFTVINQQQKTLEINNRIKAIEILEGDFPVYNLTVDDNYTVGIITGNSKDNFTGLFVSQCLEQTLESYELCCLVETYPSLHSNLEEFKRTLKYAYLYAKTVTLLSTHDSRTNAVLLRNRRIGTSMSGIVQAMQKHGKREFFNWCNEGYKYINEIDQIYSRWLCIPRSIKKTSVKPSGTVSLLTGVTPGIHFPHSKFYNRVIRFDTKSPLVEILKSAGYNCIEIDPSKEPNTTAVYFPVKEEFFDRGEDDVSMWEQLEIAAQIQEFWADNQVSITVKFDYETEGKDIKYALELYETRLKGVSFLPRKNHGFEHAPYQKITEEEYLEAIKNLKPFKLNGNMIHEITDSFCDGDKCQIASAL